MDLSESSSFFLPEKERHFWELSRADFLSRRIRRFLGKKPSGTLLDLECGDGFLLLRFAALLPGWRFWAADPSFSAERIRFLEGKMPEKIRAFPVLPENSPLLDAVTLFDVLEHMEDDLTSLRQIADRLKPGGFLFLTVPADPRLFSDHDRKLHHFRRYTQTALREVLEKSGLEICEFRGLFAPLRMIRYMEKALHLPVRSDVGRGAVRPLFLNGLFRHILNVSCRGEAFFRCQGLSWEAVCRKPR